MSGEQTASPTEQAPKASLGTRFASGLAWTAISRLATQVVSWGSFLVVARVLTPKDFGVVAGASVFTGVVSLLTEFGVGTAIIARQQVSDTERRQITGAAALAGTAGLLICLLLSTAVAHALGIPELRQILPIIGITICLSTVNSVPLALLRRDLAFSVVSGAEMAKALLQAGVTLTLALSGLEYWSLVLSELSATMALTLLLFGRLRLIPSIPRMATLGSWVGFGRDVIISRFAWYAYSNADFAIVSRRFGSTILGDYSLAWTLISLPVDKLATLLWAVAPSVLARLRDDLPAYRAYVLVLFELLGIVVLPLSLGICVTIPELVDAVLGPTWQRTVPIIQALSVFAVVKAFSPISAQILISLGDAKAARSQSLVGLAVMPLAFLAGSHWGALGVALAWTCVFPFIAVHQIRRALRAIDLPATTVFLRLWPAVLSTLVMSVVVLMVREPLAGMEWSAFLRLIVLVLAGGVSYVSVLYLTSRERLIGLYRFFRTGSE